MLGKLWQIISLQIIWSFGIGELINVFVFNKDDTQWCFTSSPVNLIR